RALRSSNARGLEPEPKQTQVESRPSPTDQIRNEFSNRARKLKPMPGTRAGDEYLRVEQMWGDQKVMIRGVRVQTNGRIDQLARCLGNESFHQPAHRFYLLGVHLAPDCVGSGRLTFVMARDFHAGAQVGKAVEKAVDIVLPKVNGTAFWPE